MDYTYLTKEQKVNHLKNQLLQGEAKHYQLTVEMDFQPTDTQKEEVQKEIIKCETALAVLKSKLKELEID